MATAKKDHRDDLVTETTAIPPDTIAAIETMPSVNLDDPCLYINRELSWLRMHERILEEAMDPMHPLLERVKFLAICGSNLDEFFMVRVSGIRKQVAKGALKLPLDGMTPTEQLAMIHTNVLCILNQHEHCWHDVLLPELQKANVHITTIAELTPDEQERLRAYFHDTIYPALTPLAMDPAHPFPFISNLSISLAVILKDGDKTRYARIKVPTDTFPRFIEIPQPTPSGVSTTTQAPRFVLLEDLVSANMDLLFPGYDIAGTYPFRVTRNADVEITLDQAGDLRTIVEESMEIRRLGCPVRLEHDATMPLGLLSQLLKNLGLGTDDAYPFHGPLGLVDFWGLLRIDRPELKDTPFLPCTPPQLEETKNLFHAIRQRDWLLYHPYDSIQILSNLLKQAAQDPDVLSIKMTMYRIDKNSPFIAALREARQYGKSVTALIELKAKFDEENNLHWAKELEHDGVHIVYGLLDFKVHAKILQIVRKEHGKIVRYSHLSSGNYNAVTGRIYGDIGYLTANQVIGEDLNNLFNALTGYSRTPDYKTLLVSPRYLKQGILDRIDREIDNHKKNNNGYLAFKLNGLLEGDIIKALYKASQAGVKIDLNCRGLCSLRPHLPGISDTIDVTSIVGRFLEHARIYYFYNNGNEDVLLGSSDMMPRNLERRVEVLFPVPDPNLRKAAIEILKIHLKDNVKARRLNPDGTYIHIPTPTDLEQQLNSQNWLIANRGIWHDIEKL